MSEETGLRISEVGCRIGGARVLLQIQVTPNRDISQEQASLVEREMDRILGHNIDALRLLAKTVSEFAQVEDSI